jgi:hypothetical protein
VVISTRCLHQAMASVVADVEGVVAAALAVTVVAVAAATPVITWRKRRPWQR